MAEAKTKPSGQDALAFLAALDPPARAAEGQRLAALFAEVTGFQPVLWGPSMVGFGRYSYRYDSGRSGESLATGFAFRGKEWALYLMAGEEAALDAALQRLGPHRRGKACLYIRRLSDIDEAALRHLIAASLKALTARWPVQPR